MNSIFIIDIIKCICWRSLLNGLIIMGAELFTAIADNNQQFKWRHTGPQMN